jgi:hypothetical protein
VSAVEQGLDTRLDGGDVSSVATCSEQLQQKQQEQQGVGTSSLDTAVNNNREWPSESIPKASPGSLPACAHPCANASAPPTPASDANASGRSTRRQSAAGAAGDNEDSDGDCLVIEPEWVTPDGDEVDLNKVSDYELRLAKVRAMPNPSMLPHG